MRTPQARAVLCALAAATLASASSLSACDAVDGGLVPVKALPPPTATGDATEGDTTTTPTVAIVSPVASSTADADWLAVEVAVTGFELDATHGVAVTVLAADREPLTVVTHTTAAVVTGAPAGPVMLRATLVVGAEATEVYAEIPLVLARTTPTVSIDRPATGSTLRADASGLEVALGVGDFTVLPVGTAPSGPRQGRVALALDGAEIDPPLPTLSTTLPLPSVGSHTLTATLVDATGAPWPGAAPASSRFEIAPAASVTVVSPTPDQHIEGAGVTVVIAPVGFATDGADAIGHGTFRVTLDGTVVASRRTGTSVPLNGLATGDHELTVELTDAAGQPLAPPVTASVSFSSELVPPSLDLVLPASSTVKAGLQRVGVVPHHYTFSAAAMGGPLVPATGGWQLLVDGVAKSASLTSAQTTVVLTPGSHTLTARLVDTSGAPLDPAVEASRALEVVPLKTAVSIVSPVSGATVAEDFTVAVALEDFTLSDQILSPSDPVVPGVGHFHAFLRKQGEADFQYQGFYLSDAFTLHVTTPGVYEVKVALHYQNHTPVVPAVEATTTVTVSDVPAVRITSPRDGATIGPEPFAVSVAADNFEIIPIPGDGSVSDTKGHYHLFIDGAYQGFFTTPVAVLDPTKTSPPLTPGHHELQALLHRSDHTFITGSIGETVDLVYDPVPKVRIVAPASGATVAKGAVEVVVAVDGLALVDKAGQANVAGEGHVHAFIDDVYENFHTSDHFALTLPSPGSHTIKVSLHQNDHTAVPGAVAAFATVNVDATPRARFVAPAEGSFTYGGDVAYMLEGWNVGPEVDVELVVDGVVEYVGPLGDGTLVDVPPLAEGPHTARATPLGASGDPLLGAVAEEVHFEVVGVAPPILTWVSPASNATVLSGSSVSLGLEGFTLESGFALRPAVPGDGLWTMQIGDRVYGPYAGGTATLPALSRGPVTVIAELWHRDLSRVIPRRTASLPLVIGGTKPAVSIASPRSEETWYGAVRVAVDVGDFAFGVTSGWLSVKVDGEQAAFVPRAEALIDGLRVGTHTLEVELVGADLLPVSGGVKASTLFRVGGSVVPALAITAPDDGTTASGGQVAVAFSLAKLTLDPAATGGPRQPGRGAVLVSVDGHVAAVASSSPVTLTGLAKGRHHIALSAAALDLVPLAPAVVDAVDVVVP